MERSAELPNGRHLLVRPVTVDDVDALMDLYAGLSIDDLHLRFFTAFRPTRKWLTEWVTAQAERGHGLVALLDEPGAPTRMVGDAGYVLLADGTGELAMTVAPDHRGWLGPYLLDALVADAAVRGVPSLQAEVLAENRRMLSMVRFRRYATVGHGDWTTVRVAIPTTAETPVWIGPHDGPRLLVEAPGGRWRATEPAQGAGFEVMVCPGPHAGRRGSCPLLEGRTCTLAAGADAIVVALPVDGVGADLVRAHGDRHPGIPVCVTVHDGDDTAGLGSTAGRPRAVVTTERNPQKILAIIEHLVAGGLASAPGDGGPDASRETAAPATSSAVGLGTGT